MIPGILAFAAALSISLALTPRAAAVGRALGAMDHASTLRKTHAGSVPRLGGVAILVAWAGGTGLALLVAGGAAGMRILALATGGLLAAIVGAWDDLRGLPPRAKLLGQLLAAAAACLGGLRIDAVAMPWGTLVLGSAAVPFTLLWIVGTMNALNLIDGLDGLAGGVAATAALALVAARGGSDALLTASGAAVAGASAGFLRHNLRSGTVFMGDGGSLFLGFALAAGAIPPSDRPSEPMALLPAVVALGIPVVDTALAVLRRAARAAPLSSGDREHLHHLVAERVGSRRTAVLLLVGASALHGVAAVALSRAAAAPALALAGALLALDLAALRSLGCLRPGLWRRVSAARRRNLALRAAVRAARARLGATRDFAEVQAALSGTAAALGARQASLEPCGDAAAAPAATPAATLLTRHVLPVGRPGGPALLLSWETGAHPDRATEIAIERLCAALAATLRRLERRPLSGLALPATGPE